MNAGQDRLLNALGMKLIDLLNHVSSRSASFLSPGYRHDAIGTAVTAAILNLDEGPVST